MIGGVYCVNRGLSWKKGGTLNETSVKNKYFNTKEMAEEMHALDLTNLETKMSSDIINYLCTVIGMQMSQEECILVQILK